MLAAHAAGSALAANCDALLWNSKKKMGFGQIPKPKVTYICVCVCVYISAIERDRNKAFKELYTEMGKLGVNDNKAEDA